MADPALVDKVKALCRTDPSAKSQWCAWCDTNMAGTKDPNRMDSDSIERFFEEYEAGTIDATAQAATAAALHAPGMPGAPGGGKGFAVAAAGPPAGKGVSKGFEQPDLAEAVKVGQRASPSWKSAWVTFCTLYGEGTFDPSKHSKDFLQQYLEFLGSHGKSALEGRAPAAITVPGFHSPPPAARNGGGLRALTAAPAPVGGVWSTPPSKSAPALPPAKRPRVGPGAGAAAAPAASADPMVAALAEKIKQMQKTDAARKQQWSEFCDVNGGGTKDPMRHNLETLQTFLDQYGDVAA